MMTVQEKGLELLQRVWMKASAFPAGIDIVCNEGESLKHASQYDENTIFIDTTHEALKWTYAPDTTRKPEGLIAFVLGDFLTEELIDKSLIGGYRKTLLDNNDTIIVYEFLGR